MLTNEGKIALLEAALRLEQEKSRELLAALKDIVMWGHQSVMPDSGAPWSVDYQKIQTARADLAKAEGR